MTIPINQARISRFAKSVSYVNALDVQQKVALSDEIFEKQPELLFEVIGLKFLSVSVQHIEHLLNLLFIFYDYFQERGTVELPQVNDEMMDKASSNIKSMLKLMDKEGQEEGLRIIGKGIEAYPEVEAMAYFSSYMHENGFGKFSRENEICLRTGKMVLDCFTHVKHLNRNTTLQQKGSGNNQLKAKKRIPTIFRK